MLHLLDFDNLKRQYNHSTLSPLEQELFYRLEQEVKEKCELDAIIAVLDTHNLSKDPKDLEIELTELETQVESLEKEKNYLQTRLDSYIQIEEDVVSYDDLIEVQDQLVETE